MEENNQYKELKQMTENLNSPDVSSINNTIKNLEEDLIINNENAKLPEFIFKEHFLDFFKNYHGLTRQDKDNSPLYAKWLELAGSEYGEVDIIDDKGETVFTTPGLFTKPTVDFDRARQIRVNDMAVDSTQKYNRTPAESSNYITSKVTSIMNGMVQVDSAEATRRWSKILKRYEKDKEPEVLPNDVPKSKIPKVVREDLGLNYD